MGRSDYGLSKLQRLTTWCCVVGWFCAFLLMSNRSKAQSQLAKDDVLGQFLRQYTEDSNFGPSQYMSAFVDLRDDGVEEVVVYLTGTKWCGSGGCTTLILAPKADTYRVITRITITRPPIRVLHTKTNGWHDLAVQVGGGGIVAHEAGLSFYGTSYPKNPTVPPAKWLGRKANGKVVIPSPPGTGTKS